MALASMMLRSRTLFFIPRSYRAFSLGISSCSAATISCHGRNTVVNTEIDTTQRSTWQLFTAPVQKNWVSNIGLGFFSPHCLDYIHTCMWQCNVRMCVVIRNRHYGAVLYILTGLNTGADLSTSVVRESFLLAVLVGQRGSAHTQTGLQGARRVVDPAVNDSTVVPTLVHSWGARTRRQRNWRTKWKNKTSAGFIDINKHIEVVLNILELLSLLQRWHHHLVYTVNMKWHGGDFLQGHYF